MGTKTLTKCQYGLESAHGTAVAADTMLLCKASLPESDRQVHIPRVDMGVRTPLLLDAAIARKILADGLNLEDADGAYFQLFPLLFSMGLVGNVTPAEQNPSEGDYLWTFAAPQTGAETVDSATLELGDDAQGYEVAYCMARNIRVTVDCESGEVHVTAGLFGDKVTATTLTGALSVPAVELCNGALARIYIDDTWAALGTAELALALVNAEINIETGVHPKHLGSASRLLSGHGQDAILGTATFTFERIAGVATEALNYRPASGYTQTPRFVRLEVTGDQIGVGDSSTLTIDMAGIWTAWKTLGDEKAGNTLDVATLTFGYDPTGAQALSVAVTTTLATI